MGWLCDKSLACSPALSPGRVPHVRGLSRTWVKQDGRSPSFFFPVKQIMAEYRRRRKSDDYFELPRCPGLVSTLGTASMAK
jgi:hypothetical protein